MFNFLELLQEILISMWLVMLISRHRVNLCFMHLTFFLKYVNFFLKLLVFSFQTLYLTSHTRILNVRCSFLQILKLEAFLIIGRATPRIRSNPTDSLKPTGSRIMFKGSNEISYIAQLRIEVMFVFVMVEVGMLKVLEL